MDEREPPKSSFTEEDRTLIRSIGGHLSRIILGQFKDLPSSGRRDELGVLANLVTRVSRELKRSRERDERHRIELERKLEELEAAREVERRLIETVRALSSPILAIHHGVLLLPIVGMLDATRAEQATAALLERIVATNAKVVILDITGVASADAQVTELLLRAARAASLLGARPILSGVSPAVARVLVELGLDLSSMTPCGDLHAALSTALRLLGARIRRKTR